MHVDPAGCSPSSVLDNDLQVLVVTQAQNVAEVLQPLGADGRGDVERAVGTRLFPVGSACACYLTFRMSRARGGIAVELCDCAHAKLMVKLQTHTHVCILTWLRSSLICVRMRGALLMNSFS